MSVGKDELAKVDALIEWLNANPVLTEAEVELRYEAFLRSMRIDWIGLRKARLTLEEAIARGRADLVPEVRQWAIKQGRKVTRGEAMAWRKDITPLPRESEIYSPNWDENQAAFRETKQDLGFNCDFVRASFMRYLGIGEVVPPYFVWRIAVLLRKAKETRRELQFLRAWCRHQSAYVALGTREKKLAGRLHKMESYHAGT